MESSQEIMVSIKETLVQLEVLIDNVRTQAEQMGVPPMSLKGADGNVIMAPLIAAKAALLVPLYDHAKIVEATDNLERVIEILKDESRKIKDNTDD